MYKLVGNRATRAFRALWLLEELGVPYEHVPAAPRSEEVRAVSPLGKVPVLVVGDDVIADSTAILTIWLTSTARLRIQRAPWRGPAKTHGRFECWTRWMQCFGQRRGTVSSCPKISACRR